MRFFYCILLSCLLFFPVFLNASEQLYDYIFFDNSPMEGRYYYSQTDYQSPSWIKNAQGKLLANKNEFYSPGNSLELQYVSAAHGMWSAEVQYRPVRGNDFFKKPALLFFQLKAVDSISSLVMPKVALRYKDKSLSNFVSLENYVPQANSGKWITLSIPLKDFGYGDIDNEYVKDFAAVVFRQNQSDNLTHTLYIDDIEFLPEMSVFSPPSKIPELKGIKAFEKHIDIWWEEEYNEAIKYFRIYRSFDGHNFVPIGIQRPRINRFTDFIGEIGQKAFYRISAVDYALQETPLSSVLSAETRKMTDEAFLNMIEEAHFRYYWDGAEKYSGLARENIPGRTDMIASGASGFGIMAVLVAIERGFISREEGIKRFLTITSFLKKADKYHGAVSHFMSGKTGKTIPFFGPKDNGGDLVETAFLTQGLLAAHQFFNGNSYEEKTIRERIDTFWRNIEWNWYKQTEDSPFLYWHWSPDQRWIINHPLIGWNETMIVYLLAIMSPTYPINPEMYYTGWASQSKKAQEYRKNWGGTEDGAMYVNGKTYYGLPLKVGVSNGGPLFFIHYSYLGLNPSEFNDRYTNYFLNNKTIAEINYRYCVENPGKYIGYGENCWGITASDFAWGYQANEPVISRDNGTIAPTGALASFPYTPKQSMLALRNYYDNYGYFLWGEYGFRDAFNLTENWCSPIFMGLNQAPITVMIENYRTHFIWDLFMSHPDVQRGIRKINNIEHP
jgi:hypothetical protein